MNFPAWVTTGDHRRLFGKAKRLGADELLLSDFDSTEGYLEGIRSQGNYKGIIAFLIIDI